MKTNRALFAGLLLAACVLTALTYSIAGEGRTPSRSAKTPHHATAIGLKPLQNTVELLFNVDKNSYSVLCATRYYSIGCRKKELAKDDKTHQAAEEDSQSRRLSEDARRFAVSGQVIPVKNGQTVLLRFKITAELEDNADEASRHVTEEGNDGRDCESSHETSLQASGSALAKYGETYTLAQFGKSKVTVRVTLKD